MTVTNATRFKEKGQTERWKNEAAKDLNILLDRCQYFRETSGDESDQASEAATVRLAQRVMEFEGLEAR